jgi:hypothetical protein
MTISPDTIKSFVEAIRLVENSTDGYVSWTDNEEARSFVFAFLFHWEHLTGNTYLVSGKETLQLQEIMNRYDVILGRESNLRFDNTARCAIAMDIARLCFTINASPKLTDQITPLVKRIEHAYSNVTTIDEQTITVLCSNAYQLAIDFYNEVSSRQTCQAGINCPYMIAFYLFTTKKMLESDASGLRKTIDFFSSKGCCSFHDKPSPEMQKQLVPLLEPVWQSLFLIRLRDVHREHASKRQTFAELNLIGQEKPKTLFFFDESIFTDE